MKCIMKKTVILLNIFLLLSSFLLSGCADESELSEVEIVVGMAIDKTSGSDSINITLETVNPKKSSGGGIKNSLMVETKGKSVYDAVQNLYKYSSTIVDFSHCQVIILSKELSQSGISKIMDYIFRDREIRNNTWLLVSNKTAKEVLQGTISNEDMTSKGIDKMLTYMGKSGYIIPVTISDFISKAESEAKASFVPVTEVDQGNVRIEKMAIFSKDRLIGILDAEESKSLLWLSDTSKGSMSIFPFNSDKNNESVTAEVIKKSSRIIPSVTDRGICFNIDCKADVVLKEMPNMKINPQMVSETESNIENILKTNLDRLLEKSQQDFNVDIPGFSDEIYMNYPQKWFAIRDHWKEIFPTIKYQTNFNVNVTSIGLIKDSINLDSKEENSK